MKKIVTILGARPQFVKAAVLSRIIRKYDELQEVIVHTGQHYDNSMSAIFFEEMNIPEPTYNLGVNGASHGAMTGEMLIKIEEVLLKEKPDLVLVYGDTNSTLAGALAAKKLNHKLVHVEAGLRSFNMKMPEEINRIVTDRIADLLLCPTTTAVDNLTIEGVDKQAVIVLCGDIMKDAVSYYKEIAKQSSTILKRLSLNNENFALATIHRQENTAERETLDRIFSGLELISQETRVIVPLHPRTRKCLKDYGLSYNVEIIDPVGYFDMLQLIGSSELVITDSGGLQKEAFFNQKPCIIARDETEWVELVEEGFATLVGSNTEQIYSAYSDFKSKNLNFDQNIFGIEVGERIYKELLNLI